MRIIYLAGYGRSGSTLIANALSSLDSAINLGELMLYATNKEMHYRKIPCSCGVEGEACSIWKNVASYELFSIYQKIRCKHVLFKEPVFSEREITNSKALLNELVSKFPNESIFIDSSKHPGLIYLYKAMGVDISIIHVYRDLDRTIESWSNTKSYLRKKKTFKVVLDWLLINFLTRRISKKLGFRVVSIKYEDFCEEPLSNINNALLKLKIKDQPKYKSRQFLNLKCDHAIAGNPSKFSQVSSVEVKPIKKKEKGKLDWLYRFFL